MKKEFRFEKINGMDYLVGEYEFDASDLENMAVVLAEWRKLGCEVEYWAETRKLKVIVM